MAEDKIKLIFEMLLGKNEVKPGVDKIKKSTKEVESSLSSLTAAFSRLKVLAASYISFEGLRQSVMLFQEQEKAIKRLNISLAQSGEFSVKASNDFIEFAKSLEKTTTIGTELILNQIAISKSFGRTNEEARKVTLAAIDLSAAMGISFESAVENLNRAFNGQIGALGKVVPSLKTLSKYMLENGAHVDIIAKKFNGFAESQTSVFDVALNKMTSGFKDLLKFFGDLVTKSPLVIESLNFIGESFAALSKALPEAIDETSKTFTDLGNDLKSGFFAILRELNPNDITRQVDEQLKSVGFTIKTNAEIMAEAKDPLSDFTKKLKEMSDQSKNSKKAIDEMNISLFATNSGISNLADLRKHDESNMQKGIELNKKFNEEQEKAAEERKQQLLGLGGLAASSLGQGAAGAGQLISGGAAFGANMIAPGAGQIVGPLVQLLGMNKEQMKQTVRAFIDGAREFILTVIENIPILITELINGLPRLIDGLIKGMPRVIQSLVDSAPELITALILQIPNLIKVLIDNIPYIVEAFSIAFISAIPSIVDGLIAQLPRMVPEIAKGIGEGVVNAIKDAFKDLFKFGGGGGIFGSLFGGAADLLGGLTGGGGGIVESIGGALGFSHGGVVPGTGNRDTVPIMATPGERVLTVQQNNILEQMLSQMMKGQSNQQPINITLEIGGRELSKVLLDISRSNLRSA